MHTQFYIVPELELLQVEDAFLLCNTSSGMTVIVNGDDIGGNGDIDLDL